MKALRIGTRGSALALAQAAIVRDSLLASNPQQPVELVVIETRGDRRLDLSLAQTDPLSKGLFTKELEVELYAGRIDLAVHSLKDLPVECPQAFQIGAVLPRECTEDVLLSLAGSALPDRAKVGTSSPRRALQLAANHPDWSFLEIRGNVPTRVRKLREEGKYDAIVLALAGLKRLGLVNDAGEPGEQLNGFHLEILTWMLPAPGQGAIAVEVRRGDTKTLEAIAPLHCPETFACVTAERELLRAIGGGCHQALGALAQAVDKSSLLLRAVYFPDPSNPASARHVEVVGPLEKPTDLARRAAILLNP